MANMRTIAKLAGVSIFTVSLALRDDPRVRPETRARIKEIADIYHYRPNRMVQAAITGKSSTIGFIMPDVASPFHSRIFRGIMERSFAASYHTLVMETLHDQDRVPRCIGALVEQRVEGILIDANTPIPISSEDYFTLRSHDIVPVFIDISRGPVPTDVVRTDEAEVGKMIVDYLVQLGHRIIGYVTTNSMDRLEIVRQQLVQAKLPTQYFFDAYHSTLDEVVEELLHCDPMPTAIIAAYDELAIQIMRMLKIRGIVVPDDISIIGCTNNAIIADLVPSLTSIEQYPEEIGRQAIDLLLRRIDEGTTAFEVKPETILIKPELIIRESCAPPRKKLAVKNPL